LMAFGRKHHLTVFSIFLASYLLFLYHRLQRDHIGVLSFFSNRIHPGLDNMIGLFGNAYLIGTHVNPESQCLSFMTSVSQALNNALSNQDISLALLTAHSSLTARIADSPITFESLIFNDPICFGELAVSRRILRRTKSEYALRIFLAHTANNTFLSAQYNATLLNNSLVISLLAAVYNLALKLVRSERKAISQMDIAAL
jgi:non-ribosomal peptide synthetase component F